MLRLRALPLMVCAALCGAGCASPPPPPPARFGTAEALDKALLERTFATDASANAARDAGAFRAWSRQKVRIKRFRSMIDVRPLGELETVQIFTVPQGSLDERVAVPEGVVAYPRDPAAVDAALKRLGIKRGELRAIEPRKKIVFYKGPRATLAYRLSKETREAELVLFFFGLKVEDIYPKAIRWKLVKRRVDRAVKTGAGLAQLGKELALIQALPFEEDRRELMKAFAGMVTDIDKRRRELEAAWPKADLVERCELMRRLLDLGRASVDLASGAELATLVEARQSELCGQLEARIATATKASHRFTAAGWTSVLATFRAGEKSAARQAWATLAGECVPVVDGLTPFSVTKLYGAESLLGRGCGLKALGLAADSHSDWRRLAGSTTRLVASPTTDDLEMSVRVQKRPHSYTIPNPAFAVWSQRMSAAQAELSRAKSAYDATKDYDRVVKKKTTYMNRDGSNKRESVITKTVRNEAMYNAHRQAAADISVAEQVIAKLARLRPPERLRRQTTIVENQQVWSGAVRRRVSGKLDGGSLVVSQTVPAPSYKVRTEGFQGSDRASENRPAMNNWTTKAALIKDAEATFSQTLGADLQPKLQAALERRVAAKLSADSEDAAWAAFAFGLPAKPESHAALKRALGLETR